jgi:hypothetical protein
MFSLRFCITQTVYLFVIQTNKRRLPLEAVLQTGKAVRLMIKIPTLVRRKDFFIEFVTATTCEIQRPKINDENDRSSHAANPNTKCITEE